MAIFLGVFFASGRLERMLTDLEKTRKQSSKKFQVTLYLQKKLVRRGNEQKSFTTTLVCQECFLAAASLRRSWRERKYGSARSTSPPHHLEQREFEILLLPYSCTVKCCPSANVIFYVAMQCSLLCLHGCLTESRRFS